MIAEITDKKVNVKQPSFFCGDKNADSLTFTISKEYNGISLADVPVYIKTKNVLGECFKRLLISKKDGEKLVIVWKPAEEATRVSGRLACQLSFEKDDGTLVLNTRMFNVLIGDSIPDGSIVSAGGQTTVVGDWRTKVIELSEIVDKGVVNSVNGKTGKVTLTAEDIGAIGAGTKLSVLENDCGFVKSDDATELVKAHDESADAHTDIRDAIVAANTAISKTTVTVVFGSVQLMRGAVEYYDAKKLKKGDQVRILEAGVPDLYVKKVEAPALPYLYTTNEAFVKKLENGGEVKIGFYVFAAVKAIGSGGGGGIGTVSDVGVDNLTITKNTDNRIQAVALTNNESVITYSDIIQAITIERL